MWGAESWEGGVKFLLPHVRASDGVASMNTLDEMKVPVSFNSFLFIHPRRKVMSAWMAGSLRLSRVLMQLYIVIESRSALKPSYTKKALMGMALRMIPLWWRFAF